eukprot:COSAG04_NODE_974_length_9060_cov_3.993974_3_plen_554_part_00
MDDGGGCGCGCAEALAEVTAELEGRERQLEQAAEYGQGLLAKNAALEDENSELRQENTACLSKVEETEWRFRELTSDVARLNELLQEKQQMLEQVQAELEQQCELTHQARAAAETAPAPEEGEAPAAAERARAKEEAAAAAAAAARDEEQEQLDADAKQAILEESERRRQAEVSAQKLRQTLARREEELGAEGARVAEVTAERDELSQQTQAERDRCNALQVKLAEMERQLQLAIAAEAEEEEEADAPALSEMLLEVQSPAPGSPALTVRTSSQANEGASATPSKKPEPSKESIALQGMLAAVQKSQQQAAVQSGKENAEQWEGLEELFVAARNMELTSDHSIDIMRRNIKRGTHSIDHFVNMISGWLEDWAKDKAEKQREEEKEKSKWAELEELWRVAMELQQLDEDTVNIQRRNIKSTDHKKKRFDIAFYINLWHQKLSDFATAEAQRAAGGEASSASSPCSPGPSSPPQVVGAALAAQVVEAGEAGESADSGEAASIHEMKARLKEELEQEQVPGPADEADEAPIPSPPAGCGQSMAGGSEPPLPMAEAA